MAVSVSLINQLKVTETLANTPGSASPVVIHDAFRQAEMLNAASTPPATKVAAFSLAMVDGAATIDLRALPGTNAGVIDGNGLKVRAIQIIAKATNTNPLQIATGDSNGYPLFGETGSIVLGPGDHFLQLAHDHEAISGTVKTIDIAGTGTQGIDCVIVVG